MGASLAQLAKQQPPSSAWQRLPSALRVLYITNRRRTGAWLAEAFSSDSATEISLEEVVGSANGLARLREEVFDAVLVSHVPGELDALDLIEGYRAGGAEEPIIVLGIQSEQEMAALCFEVGADGYACANTTTTRTLLWIFARAVQYHQLLRENGRLTQAERQRLQREHDEAERLLAQQRALIGDLESIRRRNPPDGEPVGATSDVVSPATAPPDGLPDELVDLYRELLRTYVIMGSGNLVNELVPLADLLVTVGISARQTMQLHLHVLEGLLRGLGTRSARHVMTRADLLVTELMIHLVEGYRTRYVERAHPPQQRLLPGFEQKQPVAF